MNCAYAELQMWINSTWQKLKVFKLLNLVHPQRQKSTYWVSFKLSDKREDLYFKYTLSHLEVLDIDFEFIFRQNLYVNLLNCAK